MKPIEEVSHLQMPSVDRNVMQILDDEDILAGNAPRFAVPNPISITPDTGGTWDVVDAETRLWRLRISSPGAVSINLGFTRFNLPPGASLTVGSTDGQYVVRPFNDADNNPARQLWTPVVAGADILVQLTLPTTMLGRYELEIGSINIGYRRFGPTLDPNEVTPRSGSCNVDVVCSTGDPWRLQIPAVAVISTGGSLFCTGFLVNNTSNDRRPLFQTANHCSITSGNAASLVAYWNFQNSTCRGIPGGGGTGDGSLSQFSTGATFHAANATCDFTLVEFNSAINPAFMVSYAGWDRSNTFPLSGACIHHPNTDEKRISLYDSTVHAPHGSSWPCTAFPGPGDGSHIRVYWSLGVTEPGSSGSPLFDNNKRIIGQLHGGPSACGATGDNLSDCYGRVFCSWTGGGTSATRLSDWLDPTSTGAIAVDTISGAGLSVAPSGNVTSVGVVGGPFTNPSTLYTISNPGTDPANYSVTFVGGGTAPLTMNGGAGPLSGSLNPTQSTNVTIAIDTAAANSLPAGIYSTTVRFQDTTNNLTMDRVHTIEIGQTGFTTAPANGLSAGGPVGGPFAATQVYTLTSTQPTPVNITVSSNQPWISINGVAGPVNLNLSGIGANTNVTIGYSAAANALGAGLYTGTVTFTNASGGSGLTTRPVSLDVGRFSYTSIDTPLPIADNSTTTSTINVTDNYCVGNVIVDLNLDHTYVGDLIVTLAHGAQSVILINRPSNGSGSCSSNNYRITLDDAGSGGSIQALCGASTSDPTPQSPPSYTPNAPLSGLNGVPVNGAWTLTVRDAATTDVGTLNSWTLKIASSGVTCPPIANNVNANVPDSITSPIVLSAISGNPGSLAFIIQSLPAHGRIFDPNGGQIVGVPYTLLSQGATVNYQPTSYYVGSDSFTYKANDGQDSNVATVNIQIGTLVVYDFPLDSNPGWTVAGQWAFGTPTGSCGDPSSGHTGSNVYGYNLAGCYANNLTPTQYLVTTALNFNGYQNVTLSFWRWLGVESASFDHATVDVSNNGSTWTNLYANVATTIQETSWSQQTYSISAVADGQSTVYLRWGMGTTDGSVVESGWNVNDVQFKGLHVPKLGDLNNDNVVNDSDTDLFVQVLLGLNNDPLAKARADVNSDGKADGMDVQGYTNARLLGAP